MLRRYPFSCILTPDSYLPSTAYCLLDTDDSIGGILPIRLDKKCSGTMFGALGCFVAAAPLHDSRQYSVASRQWYEGVGRSSCDSETGRGILPVGRT